jgi:ATP-binding cassette subfamily F protein 3
VLVHDGRVDDFPLSLDEYPQWLAEQSRQERVGDRESSAINSAAARKEKKRLQAEQRRQLQPLRNRVNTAEAALEKLHARQRQLEASLADPGLYSEENKDQLKVLLLEKADVDSQCECMELEWLEVFEQLEVAQGSLQQ